MIRNYNSNDLDSVLEIWLEASVKAHRTFRVHNEFGLITRLGDYL